METNKQGLEAEFDKLWQVATSRPSWLKRLKRRIWNAKIKLFINWLKDQFYKSGLFPENEFRSDLDMDLEALLVMNDWERQNYMNDLARRRALAHQRTLD